MTNNTKWGLKEKFLQYCSIEHNFLFSLSILPFFFVTIRTRWVIPNSDYSRECVRSRGRNRSVASSNNPFPRQFRSVVFPASCRASKLHASSTPVASPRVKFQWLFDGTPGSGALSLCAWIAKHCHAARRRYSPVGFHPGVKQCYADIRWTGLFALATTPAHEQPVEYRPSKLIREVAGDDTYQSAEDV